MNSSYSQVCHISALMGPSMCTVGVAVQQKKNNIYIEIEKVDMQKNEKKNEESYMV